MESGQNTLVIKDGKKKISDIKKKQLKTMDKAQEQSVRAMKRNEKIGISKKANSRKTDKVNLNSQMTSDRRSSTRQNMARSNKN